MGSGPGLRLKLRLMTSAHLVAAGSTHWTACPSAAKLLAELSCLQNRISTDT